MEWCFHSPDNQLLQRTFVMSAYFTHGQQVTHAAAIPDAHPCPPFRFIRSAHASLFHPNPGRTAKARLPYALPANRDQTVRFA